MLSRVRMIDALRGGRRFQHGVRRAIVSTSTLAAIAAVVALPEHVAANDAGSGISINGASLPGLPQTSGPATFAGSAPGLPAAGAAVKAGEEPQPPQAAQGSQSTPPPDVWSDAQVAEAKSRCSQLLAGLNAEYVFVPQMKSGACGTPAPIELSGFGKGTNVAVSPPAIVNCEVAAALHRWLKHTVQPLARQHLGSAIVQINSMSSYSCRNRYGAKKAPLSQHAFANALDIRGFVTAKEELIDVEVHWGPTRGEIAVHEARKAAEAARLAMSQPAKPGTASPLVTGAVPAAAAANPPGPAISGVANSGGWGATVTTVGVPGLLASARVAVAPPEPQGAGAQVPVMAHAAALKPTFPVLPKRMADVGGPGSVKLASSGRPARLIGVALQPGQPLDQRAHFLRNVHDGACGTWGTVLGPEANRAHRNHLHIDLAQRRNGAFCQ